MSRDPRGGTQQAWVLGRDLQEVREESYELRSSEPQAVQVLSEEAQQLMGEERVVEELCGKAGKDQLPHTLTVHGCYFTCTHTHSGPLLNFR